MYEVWNEGVITGSDFNEGKKWTQESVFHAVLQYEKQHSSEGGFIFDMLHPSCFDTKQKMTKALECSFISCKHSASTNWKGDTLARTLKTKFPQYYHDVCFVRPLLRMFDIPDDERADFANYFPRHMQSQLLLQ